jgi:hypothetical protein
VLLIITRVYIHDHWHIRQDITEFQLKNFITLVGDKRQETREKRQEREKRAERRDTREHPPTTP